MTLDELRASAPRSFDKLLVDLILAIQHGERPIETPQPVAPVISIADERVRALEAEVNALKSAIATLIAMANAHREAA